MFQAIIFDFDGVIVDSEPLHYRAFMRVLEPLGWGFDYDRYLAKYVGFDDRDFYRELFAEHEQPLDADRLRELVTAKARAFKQVVGEGVRACDGAVAMIHACAGRWPLAICSGALRCDIDLVLPAIDDGLLADRFTAIVTADDVARSKPDPACYLAAAERLGMAPTACLAIEDTVTGLAAARAAGMATLAVATTYPVDLLADADRAVETLAHLTADQLRKWFA